MSSWVSTITTAFTGFLSGMGTGIVDFFKTLVLTTTTADGVTTTSLTTFAEVALVTIGIGFAVGIVRLLLAKVGNGRA